MSTQAENDARRVVEETKTSIRRWLLLLWPMMEAIASTFRRVLLALFGGVLAERAPRQPAAPAAPEPAAVEPHAKPSTPAWSKTLVKDCLSRIAQGRRPLGNVLSRLPESVREWLRDLPQQDADHLRQESAIEVKVAFQRWFAGEPMFDVPPATSNRPANDHEEDRDDGDDRRYGMRR